MSILCHFKKETERTPISPMCSPFGKCRLSCIMPRPIPHRQWRNCRIFQTPMPAFSPCYIARVCEYRKYWIFEWGIFDLEARIIHINHAKNGNKRMVTLSDTLLEACITYTRKASSIPSSGVYFFDSGSPYNSGHISRLNSYYYFRKYLKMTGIEHRGRGLGPRLHDVRVTFAVHSLKQLTHQSGDINVHLASLSAFMGHKSIYSTQDYLWLTGELFHETLMKMEDYTSFITDIFDEKEVNLDDEGIL